VVDTSLVDDRVEQRMDLIRDLVTLGRGARESVKIKVRQPIQRVFVDGQYESLIADLVPLIQEELNVKEVVFANDLGLYMNFSLKPNFKVLGPLLGNKMGAFGKALANVSAEIAAPVLNSGGTYELQLEGEPFVLDNENVLVNISAKEGFTVSMENNLFMILDTTLSEALILEGYARELVSRVQQMRKANDFNVLDEIRIFYDCDGSFEAGIKAHNDFIKGETLAVELLRGQEVPYEELVLNDCAVKLYVEKI
jgi:isoleucyl-tRNA synthetase